jgi:hypothetical protein
MICLITKRTDQVVKDNNLIFAAVKFNYTPTYIILYTAETNQKTTLKYFIPCKLIKSFVYKTN